MFWTIVDRHCSLATEMIAGSGGGFGVVWGVEKKRRRLGDGFAMGGDFEVSKFQKLQYSGAPRKWLGGCGG